MNRAPASAWRRPTHFLAFGLGSGCMPWAPGTFGTLAAIPFFWLMSDLPLAWYMSIVAVAFVVGIWLCEVTSHDLGVHDHSGIVWDEFVGYWITMAAVPSLGKRRCGGSWCFACSISSSRGRFAGRIDVSPGDSAL